MALAKKAATPTNTTVIRVAAKNETMLHARMARKTFLALKKMLKDDKGCGLKPVAKGSTQCV